MTRVPAVVVQNTKGVMVVRGDSEQPIDAAPNFTVSSIQDYIVLAFPLIQDFIVLFKILLSRNILTTITIPTPVPGWMLCDVWINLRH